LGQDEIKGGRWHTFETKKTQRQSGEAATKWPSVVPSLLGGVAAASRNFGAADLSAADGVVVHKSYFVVSDHPVRSNKEASRHFLYVASTPPHEEGTTLAQKLLEKNKRIFLHTSR
jgi:hypothetical protein